MMTTLNLSKLGVIFSFLATSLFAQTGGKPISLAGTVVADNMTGLSYRVRGCITVRFKRSYGHRHRRC